MHPLLARLLLAFALVGNSTLNEVLASLMAWVPAVAANATAGPTQGCHHAQGESAPEAPGIPLPPCCTDGAGACHGLCMTTAMMSAPAVPPLLDLPPPRIARTGMPGLPPMPASVPLRPPIA